MDKIDFGGNRKIEDNAFFLTMEGVEISNIFLNYDFKFCISFKNVDQHILYFFDQNSKNIIKVASEYTKAQIHSNGLIKFSKETFLELFFENCEKAFSSFDAKFFVSVD